MGVFTNTNGDKIAASMMGFAGEGDEDDPTYSPDNMSEWLQDEYDYASKISYDARTALDQMDGTKLWALRNLDEEVVTLVTDDEYRDRRP